MMKSRYAYVLLSQYADFVTTFSYQPYHQPIHTGIRSQGSLYVSTHHGYVSHNGYVYPTYINPDSAIPENTLNRVSAGRGKSL